MASGCIIVLLLQSLNWPKIFSMTIAMKRALFVPSFLTGKLTLDHSILSNKLERYSIKDVARKWNLIFQIESIGSSVMKDSQILQRSLTAILPSSSLAVGTGGMGGETGP